MLTYCVSFSGLSHVVCFKTVELGEVQISTDAMTHRRGP